MERAAASWRYDELHDKAPFHDGTFKSWAKERSTSHPYHYRDGVTIWIAETDFAPHDHFLGGEKDCPECSATTRGEHDQPKTDPR